MILTVSAQTTDLSFSIRLSVLGASDKRLGSDLPFLPRASEPKGPLDASLKKHTTLINKLRSAILTSSADTLIKEIDGLTLTKYVAEIVAATVDGITGSKGGKADIDSVVEVRAVSSLVRSRCSLPFFA
jgi:hypothetical protein